MKVFSRLFYAGFLSLDHILRVSQIDSLSLNPCPSLASASKCLLVSAPRTWNSLILFCIYFTQVQKIFSRFGSKVFLIYHIKKPKILISLTNGLRKIVYIGKSVARGKMWHQHIVCLTIWHHLFLVFWLVNTWFFAHWRHQRAVTHPKNVRQLNIKRGKTLGFQLSHRQLWYRQLSHTQ